MISQKTARAVNYLATTTDFVEKKRHCFELVAYSTSTCKKVL